MELFGTKTLTMGSPMTGRAAPLSETPDRAFSAGKMGAGVVIFPTIGEVLSPCDGKVEFSFPKKYAVGMETEHDGVEFVIHVGIGTNALPDDCFELLAEPGQRVRRGDVLIRFDLARVEAQGVPTATPFVFTNLDDGDLTVLRWGEVQAGDDLLEVRR